MVTIEELEHELAQKKEDKRKFEAMPVEYQIADILHSTLCDHNHTDACSWYYRTWNDYVYGSDKYTRDEYVDKAKSMLAVADKDTIFKIINLL